MAILQPLTHPSKPHAQKQILRTGIAKTILITLLLLLTLLALLAALTYTLYRVFIRHRQQIIQEGKADIELGSIVLPSSESGYVPNRGLGGYEDEDGDLEGGFEVGSLSEYGGDEEEDDGDAESISSLLPGLRSPGGAMMGDGEEGDLLWE
ncbi:MAG: hypothetical protein Q9188_002225 [Gyalolechia gomerana]